MNTQYYGWLEIRYDRTYINNVVDMIQDTEGNYYTVATNFNGKLQLFKEDE